MSKITNLRYKKTIRFLKDVLPSPASVLDLGINNPLSNLIRDNGYTVYNTEGEDLDEFPNGIGTIMNLKIGSLIGCYKKPDGK